MTKEEKKLFKKIKCKCGYGIRTQASFDVIEEMEGTKAKEKAIEYQGEVDFLIYLIEKLQKENEELKIKNCRKNQIIYAYEERTDISEGELAELIDLEEE